MTCIKAQGMITPFIHNKLSIKELEEFLDHVNSCPNCREELEIYYALLTAMKQLDEDKSLSSDFSQELSDKLEQTQDRIIHAKYTYYRKKAIYILVVIFLALFLSLRYPNKEMWKDNAVEVSNFQLRMNFHDTRDDIIDRQLQDYLQNMSLTPSVVPHTD